MFDYFTCAIESCARIVNMNKSEKYKVVEIVK